MFSCFPYRRDAQERLRSGRKVPVAACLPLESKADELFRAVDFKAPCLLLESCRTHPVTGRYSLIVGEPSAVLTARGNRITLESSQGTRSWEGDPLGEMQRILDRRRAVRPAGFPPFVGGAVGFLGYDACRHVEPISLKSKEDMNLPDLGFLFCDEAIVLDHLEEKLWVIALADPSGDLDRSYDEAVARVERLRKRITRTSGTISRSFPPSIGVEGRLQRESDPRFREDDVRRFQSTHTRAEFERMVREAKRFISDGEIYQVNLSQRFSMPLAQEPWELYRRIRAINPSPFAAYADFGGFQILSGSPERLLRVQGRRVETRPIAGTRPKGRTAVETARLRQELILNEKERAEHLMLVDLERNDLGRVCRYGSVRVDEFMVLEEYSHVIHIVSNVRGVLRPSVRPVDLIAAAFPGGTITGCPKIRSLEVIDSLEPVRRKLYTGSLGYISASGEIDFNLLIRTAVVAESQVHVQAGAGIVADSDPGKEYEETVHKAQALLEALDADAAPVAAVSV